MKKKKAFMLLELLIVMVIIWIVSTSLINARKNISWTIDTWREAVNIIYKEMDKYIKDFQRNKIWEDTSWNVHEINYFRIDCWTNTQTGTQLIVWNYYTGDDYEYFNSWTFIKWSKYSAFQYLKWSEKYTFYTRNKSEVEINPIRISNWKIYNNPNDNALDQSEYQFVICWWEWWYIWAITINAISKESRLDRCKTERYSWIDCSIFEDC